MGQVSKAPSKVSFAAVLKPDSVVAEKKDTLLFQSMLGPTPETYEKPALPMATSLVHNTLCLI